MSTCKSKSVLFGLIFLLIFVMPPPLTFADEPIKEGVDVVLLIDTSGSMRASDKGRNAIEAVNMFVDMLQTKYSRISVLAFNDQISTVMDMTEVTSISDKEKIKSTVNSFEYDGFTDIGVPLLEGVNKLLADARAENSPMILLLTDGKIEMDPERTDRTETDSYDDITQALAQANNRFPVYTIGLNYDNSVDEQLLHTISSATKGRSYIINEAAALPQIFNEIFADHIESSLIEVASFNTDGEAYNELIINIESDFVSEANIIILSGEELADVKLFDPSGVETEFNQQDITYSKSKKYSIIKVMMPERGEWLLKTKGVKGDRIQVNLLYQYDAAIAMAVSQDGEDKTEYDSLNPMQITGSLFVNGNEYNDAWLYNETQATLFVERENVVLEEIPLTVKDNQFFGEYNAQSADQVTIYIKVENQDFTKTSNKSDIGFAPVPEASEAPEVQEEPPVIEVEQEPVDEPSGENPIKKWMIQSVIVIAVTAVALLLIARILFPKKKAERFFEGHIEIRMKDSKGKYTPMETPLLKTYVNSFTLQQFVSDNLKQGTINKIKKMPVDLSQVVFTPGKENGISVVYVENKTSCLMFCENGDNTEPSSSLVLKDRERLVLKLDDNRNTTIVEMTYRVEEN